MNNLKGKVCRIVMAIFAAVTMLFNVVPVQAAIEGGVNVHFLNVGKGDCIVVEYDGHYMLIDSGYGKDSAPDETPADYSGFKNAVKWIENEQIKKFDYVVLTHYDSDHAKGLETILACNGGIDVGQFIARKYSEAKLNSMYAAFQYGTSNNQYVYYQKLIKLVSNYSDAAYKTDLQPNGNNSVAEVIAAYDKVKGGDKWKFYSSTSNSLMFNNDVELMFVNNSTSFLPASKAAYDENTIKEYAEDVNDDSLAFVMKYKNVKYLFLGDLKKDGLDYALQKISEKNISTKNCVMKVPHHGIFSTKTLPANKTGFTALKPSVAIFSTSNYYYDGRTTNIHSILRNASGAQFTEGKDEFYTCNATYGYCVSTSGNAFNVYAEKQLYSSVAESKKDFVKNIKF